MKRFVLAALLCCALTGAMVVAGDKKPESKTPVATSQPTTKPSAVAINKFCAVETDNPIDPSVPTVTYKGKVIGFCCEDCIPKFKKDPEAYMKGLK